VAGVKGEAAMTAGQAIRLAWADGGEVALAPGTPTNEILEYAMRRVHAVMVWAGQQSDMVSTDKFWVRYYDAQGNIRVEPNKWFVLERAMREEAVKLATKMVELGLAERAVAVEEAKAVMVAQAVRAAAEAAGLAPLQIERLGEELRKGLASGAVAEVAA
jgi:glutamate 5-kinase